MNKIVFLIIFIFFDILFGNSLKQDSANISDQLKEFIKEHKVITLGSNSHLDPYIIVNDDGTISGFDMDVLKLVNKYTGANFTIKASDWDSIQKEAKEHKIDGLTSLVKTSDREKWLFFTKPYINIQKTILTSYDSNIDKLSSLKLLENKSIVIVKGNVIDTQLAEKLKMNIIYVKNEKEAFLMVLDKKVSFTFGNNSSVYQLAKLGLPLLKELYQFGDNIKLRFAINKTLPKAYELLKIGLDKITYKEFQQLEKKWFLNNNTYKNILQLTKEEKEYLKNHKTITVHNEKSWAPYNFRENGEARGYSIDFMNLIAKKLNIKIRYISGYTWKEFLSLIKDEKIDVISNIAKTPLRTKYINFTTPYIKSKKAIFSNTKGYDNLDSLSNKTVAISDGFFIEEYLKKYYPSIKIKKYKDTFSSIIAVINNEADALVENYAVVNYLIKKYGLNIKYISINEDDKLISNISLGIRKSQTILRDILQKAQDSISKKELQNLEDKWFGLNNEINPITFYKKDVQRTRRTKSFKIKLTTEEKKYLNKKNSIKMCVDPNWMPFEKIDKNGNYIGIVSEYPKLFAKRLGIDFKLVKTKNFAQSRQFLSQNRCDIIMADVATKQNNKLFLHTKPYIISPRAYVTHNDTPWVNDFSYLVKSKYKIGIVKNSPAKSILKERYNNIKLSEFDTTIDGLKAVSAKKIISFVSIMPNIAYTMQTNILSDIKIAGYLKSNVKLSIIVNKEQANLVPILNKVIDSITQKERLDIFDKWIKVTIDQKIDYKYLKITILIFILILLIGLYMNILLKRRVKEEVLKNQEKEKFMLYQSRLAQMGEMISMIAHQWRQPLNNLSVLSQTVVLKYNRGKLDDKAIKYFEANSKKQIQSMSKTIDDFRDFFKPEKSKVEFCINNVIENTIHMMEPIFSANDIEVIFDSDSKHNVIGYPNELGQALLNIINNAKDVLIENNIDNKRITILLRKEKNSISIVIKDNGGGIPPDNINKIFDPYFSTKDNKNGTGLGLYMTKMIVEDHCAGKITASNDDDGAVFKINLG